MLHHWLNLQWLVDVLFGDAWISLGLSDVSDASVGLAFAAAADTEGAFD